MRKHSRLVAQLKLVQQDLTSFLNEDVINQAGKGVILECH